MRPKTRQQHRVIELSSKLPNLEKTVTPWAFEKVIKHLAYRNKSNTSCLSCGHVWKGNDIHKKDVCPSCKRRVTVEDSRKKKLSQLVYFAVIDTCDEFQLNRYFQMRTYHKSGQEPRIYLQEIVQQFMKPDGKHELVARNRGGMSYYQNHNFSGELEIRDRTYMHGKYNIWPSKIYPKMKYLPIYKRNGFKGNFGESTPFDIFNYILKDSKAETLIKTKQYSLLDVRFSSKSEKIEKFWNSIKICIRNGYIVKDALTFLDYLQLLEFFKKDLYNSKFVCPENLKQVHDKLVAKKRKIDRLIQIQQDKEFEARRALEKQREREERISRMDADQLEYVSTKSYYFRLQFTDGDLTIKVLESVQEFLLEGDTLNHCVFTNEYYKEEDSLILSARINGVSIETIEVSLSELRIIQSRGKNNQPTAHSERVRKLVQKNMRHIAKISKSALMVAA
ncbi:PcfJ domain-containing protein [Pedobacter sp. P351]|uniref:PcfJ domain-containing protein n=1 Tax=Pedobacter superstes TaxID=3133441 RepID=UPI0030AEEFFE